jgi:putative acetyltransferase
VNVKIRDARDDDSDGLIRLIGDCSAEYPGCVLDVEGEAPELIAPATWHTDAGGRLWVAERDGAVVGSVAILPDEERSVELKKLYVSSGVRRLGLGARLCELVEAEARARGVTTVMLWSDTRFEDAHRLYEGRGYERGPDTRELHDVSKSVEYYFRKSL